MTTPAHNPSAHQQRWWNSINYASVSADTTSFMFRAKTRSIRLVRAHLNTDTTITADASNYVIFKVIKNAATVVASWSTLLGAANQGTITAGTAVDLALTATLADTFLADGDKFSLLVDVTGTITVPTGRLVIDGYEI